MTQLSAAGRFTQQLAFLEKILMRKDHFEPGATARVRAITSVGAGSQISPNSRCEAGRDRIV